MSKTTIRHGAKVECDVNACKAPAFVTYSITSLARAQAAQVGWGRLPLKMFSNWQSRQMGSDGRRKLDACPHHAHEARTMYAALQDRTAAEKLADRAKAKQAKLDAKLAEKKAKADARAAKREAAKATRKRPSKAKVAT